MGRVFTRNEVADLVESFEKHVFDAVEVSCDVHLRDYAGLQCVKKELANSTGLASAKLREFARVLKHFTESNITSETLRQANHALMAVNGGQDATKAIKRSRHWNNDQKGNPVAGIPKVA